MTAAVTSGPTGPLRLRPGWVALRSLATLVIAAGIAAWAARGISWPDLRASLSGFHLLTAIAALALFAGSFFAVEVIGFGLSWRRHLVPVVRWRDVATLVCGKRVLFVILPLLTKAVAPLYFWRRWRVRPLHAVSASELVGAADQLAVLLFVFGAWLGSAVQLGPGVAALAVGAWLVAIAGFAWLWSPRAQRVLPRLRGAALLHAFARTTPAELSLQVGLRAAQQLAALGSLWLLLRDQGVRLSAPQLLSFGPLFVFSGMLPLSLAGYGGPQGLAVGLLAHQWRVLSPARALAFSLVWSTGLLIVQTSVGLAWLPRLINLLRERAPEVPAEERGHG